MQRVTTLPTVGNYTEYKIADHVGALALMIVPKGAPREVDTKFGRSTFIDVDIYEFPDMGSLKAGEPVEYVNASFGQTAIVNALRDSVGCLVGPVRIGQVPSKKGNPAWILEMLSPSDAGYSEANAWADAFVAKLDQAPPPPAF